MLGGIGNGRRNLVSVRVGELPAARPTEALPARHLGSAVRTDPGEPCTAVLAEPRPRGIRSLAPWTPHRASRQRNQWGCVNRENILSIAEGTAMQEAAAAI